MRPAVSTAQGSPKGLRAGYSRMGNLPRAVKVGGAAGLTLGAALLAGAMAIRNPFYFHVVILVLINAGFALGLAIVVRVGYWPLGQAAFLGLGGYTSAILSTRAGWPIWLSAAMAVVVTAVTAAAIGGALMRLRGVYFIMVTFAFAELMRLTFVNQRGIFGGSGGISGIPSLRLPYDLGVLSGELVGAFIAAAFVLTVDIVIAMLILTSSVGSIWKAIRQTPELAEAQGVATHRFKVYAFTVGGAMAAAAGVIQAHYTQFIAPTMFDIHRSIDPIVATIVGGAGSLLGPIVGVALLMPLPELFRTFQEYQHIFFGLTLALVALTLPGGLVGGIGRLAGRVMGRTSRADS